MAVGKLSFLLSKDLLVGALVSEGEHHTHVSNPLSMCDKEIQ